MRIDILTLFPDLFEPVLGQSITGRARAAGIIDWTITDIRRYANNKHNKVDDRPFGGGPGMVMMCQPLWDAVKDVESAGEDTPVRIMLTPQGEKLTQPIVEELATEKRLLLIAGHYEGIDQRVIDRLAPREISVGDYVLSGGEIPALLLVDAITRLLPGALGHEDSAAQDSFSARDEDGHQLLDCPHYTRPREWAGETVPDVLVSGDHGKVSRWRLERMIETTRARRPDLLDDENTTTPPSPTPGN